MNPNGYLFARPSDGQFPEFAEVFSKVLDDLHVHTDPVTGVRRRLYSCRHYYATQSLLHGVSPYDVSKNMGNSERMIRIHYDHVLIDMRSRCPDWLRSDGWCMAKAARQSGEGPRSDSE